MRPRRLIYALHSRALPNGTPTPNFPHHFPLPFSQKSQSLSFLGVSSLQTERRLYFFGLNSAHFTHQLENFRSNLATSFSSFLNLELPPPCLPWLFSSSTHRCKVQR